MAAIRFLLDDKLLKDADYAAKRGKMNRSALIRNALEEHLKRLNQLELEKRDREGYLAQPQKAEEFQPREAVAVWPTD